MSVISLISYLDDLLNNNSKSEEKNNTKEKCDKNDKNDNSKCEHVTYPKLQKFRPINKSTGRLPQYQGQGKFGITLAVSGTGQFLAAGSPSYPYSFSRSGGTSNRVGVGIVLIYENVNFHEKEKEKPKWKLIQSLTPNAATAPDIANAPLGFGTRTGNVPTFGFSLDLDYHGTRLVVGAPSDGQGGPVNGAVFIYNRVKKCKTNTFVLNQKVVPILPNSTFSGVAAANLFGAAIYTISINKNIDPKIDGTFLAVCGIIAYEFDGAVVVFHRENETEFWNQLVMEGAYSIRLPADASLGSQLGLGLQFNSTGEYLVAGAPGDQPTEDFSLFRGSTYVFYRRKANAIQRLDPKGFNEVTTNNNVLFKAVPTKTDFVYEQVGPKLVGTPTSVGQNQGVAVAISDDGKTVAVTGSNGEDLPSYVYIFKLVGCPKSDPRSASYNQIQAIQTATVAQLFGAGLFTGDVAFAQNDKVLIVGAPLSVPTTNDSGTVYKGSVQVYTKSKKCDKKNFDNNNVNNNVNNNGPYFLKQSITDLNADNDATEGTNVAISKDAQVLAFNEESFSGGVFVYNQDC